VLLAEFLNVEHMSPVVVVLLPFESGRHQEFVSVAGTLYELLIAHIKLVKTRQLAKFPVVMTDVEGVMHGAQKDHAVDEQGPLVSVPPHHWVLSLNHFLTYYTI